MAGIIRIGVTERGSFKNIFGNDGISRSSKAMHNIKLPLTYSEFTVHMQNQLQAGSFGWVIAIFPLSQTGRTLARTNLSPFARCTLELNRHFY